MQAVVLSRLTIARVHNIKRELFILWTLDDSESQGQEEAGLRDERVSYLHVALLWKLLTF